MEPFDRPSGSEEPFASRRRATASPTGAPTGSRTRIAHTPKAYRVCDWITGGLILFMLVFTPWAFGTTQDWSMRMMNITGFVLGATLLAKWLIRQQTGYRPVRLDQPSAEPSEGLILDPQAKRRDPLTLCLAILTLVVLSYILVGAINWRADFLLYQRRFIYHDCISWLPHSYDSSTTWQYFWTYTSLACFFWATRDWLLSRGSSARRKRKHSRERTSFASGAAAVPAELPLRTPLLGQTGPMPSRADPVLERSRFELPARLQLLLWVLCINGAILALESILQRLSGTNKLLWLVVPRFDTNAQMQFGPYAYRANAASYFNLVWPVSLGFWLVLRQAARGTVQKGARVGGGSYLVLLPGAVLMAACPIISTTRGGSVIAVAGILMMMGLLLWSTRKESLWFRLGACSLFVIIIVFSGILGLKELVPRFKTIFSDQMSNRLEIYRNAVQMERDFPVLGTGAGTFSSLYQLYRANSDEDWAAYVHDDWLETRITFGWLGFSLILLMLAGVLARWFLGPGIPVAWELTATIWMAVAGCLLHAKFDFPMQVYSVLLLFLLLAAILFCVAQTKSQA
jgi:hypothetical protein